MLVDSLLQIELRAVRGGVEVSRGGLDAACRGPRLLALIGCERGLFGLLRLGLGVDGLAGARA